MIGHVIFSLSEEVGDLTMPQAVVISVIVICFTYFLTRL